MLETSVKAIDILLVFLLVWGGYKGFKRGSLMELLSTFILIAGITLIFWGISSSFTYVHVASRSVSFVTLVIIFIVGGIALSALGRKMQGKINYSIFDDFDNFIGMALGLLKYAVFLAIIIKTYERIEFGFSSTGDLYIYPMLLKFYDMMIQFGTALSPEVGCIDQTLEGILHDGKLPDFSKIQGCEHWQNDSGGSSSSGGGFFDFGSDSTSAGGEFPAPEPAEPQGDR